METTTSDTAAVPRLVRLPNGAWIRFNAVTAIRPLTEKGSDLHLARVVVHHGGLHEILLANDNEHAQAMADELAGVFNGEPNPKP
jgi:hypothetical protein